MSCVHHNVSSPCKARSCWKCPLSHTLPTHLCAGSCRQTADPELEQNTGLHEVTQSGLRSKHNDAATQRQVIQLRQEKAELKHEINALRVRGPIYNFFCDLVCVSGYQTSINRILLDFELCYLPRTLVCALFMASRALTPASGSLPFSILPLRPPC